MSFSLCQEPLLGVFKGKYKLIVCFIIKLSILFQRFLITVKNFLIIDHMPDSSNKDKKFLMFKKNFLSKQDKSKKGSVDQKIKGLTDKINSLEPYYTTSSCAGRILLFKEPESGKKNEGEWLFVSHNILNKKGVEEITNIVAGLSNKENIWFRFEPAILHVVCKNIDSARSLLKLVRDCGFKQAGIIGITKDKFTLEIRSSERIDVPVNVVKDFDSLISVANGKLEESWKKVEKLEKKSLLS